MPVLPTAHPRCQITSLWDTGRKCLEAVWQPLARTWVLATCAKTTSAAKSRKRISKNWQGWVREHRESWSGDREVGNLSAPTAPFHRESTPLPPVSGADRDKMHPGMHSLLRGEVPTHAHLPTRMTHRRPGGQLSCSQEALLDSYKYCIQKLPLD